MWSLTYSSPNENTPQHGEVVDGTAQISELFNSLIGRWAVWVRISGKRNVIDGLVCYATDIIASLPSKYHNKLARWFDELLLVEFREAPAGGWYSTKGVGLNASRHPPVGYPVASAGK